MTFNLYTLNLFNRTQIKDTSKMRSGADERTCGRIVLIGLLMSHVNKACLWADRVSCWASSMTA